MQNLEKEIIEQYQNGKSISVLAREYTTLSYRAIQKILVHNNIPIRGGRKKKTLTNEQLEQLKKLFIEEGVYYKELSTKFDLSAETIRNIIEAQGWKRKNNNRINKHIRSDYFSNVDSEDKAYWLGILFTDGSVDQYRATGRIRLQFQAQDKDLLEAFKTTLCLESKLIEDKRANSICYSVEFVDQQIFEDLGKYGIIPQKTYKTEHLPLELIPQEFWPAFARGLYDGDGSLSCSSNYSTDVNINFTSYHENIAKEFQLLVDNLINKTEHNKIIYTSAWHAMWRGRLQVVKILYKLYENAGIYLERKHNKYLELKASIE